VAFTLTDEVVHRHEATGANRDRLNVSFNEVGGVGVVDNGDAIGERRFVKRDGVVGVLSGNTYRPLAVGVRRDSRREATVTGDGDACSGDRFTLILDISHDLVRHLSIDDIGVCR
jgi:hypothetical protein